MGWPFLVAPNLGASLCCVVGAVWYCVVGTASLCCVVGTGPSKIASHRRDVDCCWQCKWLWWWFQSWHVFINNSAERVMLIMLMIKTSWRWRRDKLSVVGTVQSKIAIQHSTKAALGRPKRPKNPTHHHSRQDPSSWNWSNEELI